MASEVEAHQQPAQMGDVWKWIAAAEATILTALLLAAIPAIFWVFRTPSQADVGILRERQQIVLQRLATVDEGLAETSRNIENIWLIVARLQVRLDDQQGGKK